MRRSITASLALLLVLALLSGCGARPLPQGMEEQAVGEAAEQVLEMLTAGDYQGVADAFREDMREQYQVDAATVQEAMQAAGEAGAYARTTDILAVGGKKSKSFDEDYAVAVLYCEHEEKTVIYEFSFDTSLALIGLAVKQK